VSTFVFAAAGVVRDGDASGIHREPASAGFFCIGFEDVDGPAPSEKVEPMRAHGLERRRREELEAEHRNFFDRPVRADGDRDLIVPGMRRQGRLRGHRPCAARRRQSDAKHCQNGKTRH
jgi:hypothetical protein